MPNPETGCFEPLSDRLDPPMGGGLGEACCIKPKGSKRFGAGLEEVRCIKPTGSSKFGTGDENRDALPTEPRVSSVRVQLELILKFYLTCAY